MNCKGTFQAVYTAGVVLPKPVATCRYWHRSLNPKKLVEVKFSHLSRNMTMQRQIKLLKLPETTKIDGIRQGFLLRTWIPCLCPKFLNLIPLDLAKYGFSTIWRSSKVMNFHKIWGSWLKSCACYALFNFEIPKGMAVSIFVPHPSTFGQIWIFDRQKNDVLSKFLYL